MVTKTLEQALAAARQAKAEGLHGMYPSACIVMADFIERIGFPRRGSEDERATIYDFAKEIQAATPAPNGR
jgi:hypothetical protein